MSNLESTEPRDTQSRILNRDNPTRSSDIDFLDTALVLANEKRLILFVTLAMMAAAALVSFLIRPTFTASATILPPQQQQQSILSNMAGPAGSIAAMSQPLPLTQRTSASSPTRSSALVLTEVLPPPCNTRRGSAPSKREV